MALAALLGASLGFHESQSRLWENWVGRGRPYLEHLLPRLRELFPAQFGDLSPEALYRAANRIEPSLIRVEADQVTYNLHIVLRFELEVELFEGRLEPADLPEAWNARMAEYLGARGSGRRGTACFRTCTGPAGRSATSRPTRSAT